MSMTVVSKLFDEPEVARRVEALAGEISKAVSGDFVIVGLLKGSFVFVADLIRALDRQGCKPGVEFLRVSSYGSGKESSGRVRLTGEMLDDVAGRELLLVDLPGYGYAKAAKSERASWKGLIEGYLGRREALRAAVLLQDVRRMPGEEELDLLAWLAERQIPVLVALTKLDKLKAKEKVKRLRALEAAIPVQADWRIQTSAKTGAGVDRLWQVLGTLL